MLVSLRSDSSMTLRSKLIPAWTCLLLASQSVSASQTACVFSADKAQDYYEVEFIGYGDTKPMIVFSSTSLGAGKRLTLHPGNYTLTQFSQKAGKVDMKFRNPEDPAQPPSFSLVGAGGRARLAIGSSIVAGDFKCDS